MQAYSPLPYIRHSNGHQNGTLLHQSIHGRHRRKTTSRPTWVSDLEVIYWQYLHDRHLLSARVKHWRERANHTCNNQFNCTLFMTGFLLRLYSDYAFSCCRNYLPFIFSSCHGVHYLVYMTFYAKGGIPCKSWISSYCNQWIVCAELYNAMRTASA